MAEGSSINITLGAELGVLVEVTHSGDPPDTFVAVQPEGNAGATTPSKFSERTVAGVDPGPEKRLNESPKHTELGTALAVAPVTAGLTVIVVVAVALHVPLLAVTV
jgi:hypothetical protein